MPKTLDRKFETVAQGYFCGHTDAANYTVKDRNEWKNLWEETNSKVIPTPKLPKVNFDEEMVIGVYLGEKSSGGYDIEVLRLNEKKDCLEVHVMERSPKEEMMSVSALTQPYHLIRTAKTDKEVKFVTQN